MKKILSKTAYNILIIACLILISKAIGHAIDSYFDNQDRMLCNSAKVSGNEEYLEKCECFYNGEDIRCIHEPTILSPIVKEVEAKEVPTPQVWEGEASYYSEDGCVGCREDRLMANGERFNENAMTIAFNKLPLGTFVEVTNVSNGQTVAVKVTDTGGFEALDRIADLSLGVKEVLNCSDLCDVRIKEL